MGDWYGEIDEEDDAELADIEFLQETFAGRDSAYKEATQAIVDVIGPTAIAAIHRMLEVEEDQVVWSDFHTNGPLVVVECEVTYNPSEGIPPLIKNLGSKSVDVVNEVITQTIRVGIPYAFVMKDPDEIIDYMNGLIESKHNIQQEEEIDPFYYTPDEDDAEFDTDVLSEQQRKSYSMIQDHYGTGGKLH